MNIKNKCNKRHKGKGSISWKPQNADDWNQEVLSAETLHLRGLEGLHAIPVRTPEEPSVQQIRTSWFEALYGKAKEFKIARTISKKNYVEGNMVPNFDLL